MFSSERVGVRVPVTDEIGDDVDPEQRCDDPPRAGTAPALLGGGHVRAGHVGEGIGRQPWGRLRLFLVWAVGEGIEGFCRLWGRLRLFLVWAEIPSPDEKEPESSLGLAAADEPLADAPPGPQAADSLADVPGPDEKEPEPSADEHLIRECRKVRDASGLSPLPTHVVYTEAGKKIGPSTLTETWGRRVRDRIPGFEGVRLHDLRHSAASDALMAGGAAVLVRHHLAGFLERVEEGSHAPLPDFVQGELRGFAVCGDFSQGFVRTACCRCGDELRVPFPCKGRGFCPSCMGRRMAEGAALLVDQVLPPVGYRQWVLSFSAPSRSALLARVQRYHGVGETGPA